MTQPMRYRVLDAVYEEDPLRPDPPGKPINGAWIYAVEDTAPDGDGVVFESQHALTAYRVCRRLNQE